MEHPPKRLRRLPPREGRYQRPGKAGSAVSLALAAPVGADAHYFGRLAQGVFEIPRCRACARHHFFPRICCPHCGSEALEWVAPSGAGTVYSSTIVRRPEGDYTVCLVDLDEGPRLMSRVVGTPVEQVRIGMAVRAQVDQTDDGPLLVFAPRGDAS